MNSRDEMYICAFLNSGKKLYFGYFWASYVHQQWRFALSLVIGNDAWQSLYSNEEVFDIIVPNNGGIKKIEFFIDDNKIGQPLLNLEKFNRSTFEHILEIDNEIIIRKRFRDCFGKENPLMFN